MEQLGGQGLWLGRSGTWVGAVASSPPGLRALEMSHRPRWGKWGEATRCPDLSPSGEREGGQHQPFGLVSGTLRR